MLSVFVYGFALWSLLISMTASKIVPRYDFVGLEQYVTLWSMERWHVAVGNLVIFAGMFVVQWGIGLLIDAARARGADDLLAFRVAFSVFGALGVLSYAVYRRGARHLLARGLPGDNGSP